VNFAEFWKKLSMQRYIKMYLVREGTIIGEYIRGIKERGWILDKTHRMAWMIPKEGNLIKQKKCYFFFASLESIMPFKYDEIIKKDDLKGKFWDKSREFSIPFLRPAFYPGNWTIEKTKLVLREGKDYQIIDKMGKVYSPVLPTLDISALYEYLSAASIDMVMESPKSRTDYKWVLYALAGIAILVFVYYIMIRGR
jgi:hypothetical protein